MMEISAIMGQTLNDLLNWALAITGIMIVYYVIKFFLVGGLTPEEKAAKKAEEKEAWEKVKNMVSDKQKGKKEREEMKKREDRVAHPKAHLVLATENCEDLSKAFSRDSKETAVRVAKRELKELKHNLAHAVHYLKHMRRHEKGKLYQFLDSLYAAGGVALKKVEEIKIPAHDADHWNDKVKEVKGEVKRIREICGLIIGRLDDYMETAATEAMAAIAETEAQRQAEEAARRRGEGRPGSTPAPGRPGSRRRPPTPTPPATRARRLERVGRAVRRPRESS